MDEIADFFKEDFYIIPSSIHEVILFPRSKAPSKKELDRLIQKVNQEYLDPEEYLSDHAYYHSKSEQGAGEYFMQNLPELYARFSEADVFLNFGDYLNSHYDVSFYGNADHLSCYRICDHEFSEQETGDYFYFLDLNRSPSLFRPAYTDFGEIIQEVKSKIGEILPPDFPFEEYLLEILGETWG